MHTTPAHDSAINADTPIGPLSLYATNGHITQLSWAHTSDQNITPFLQDAAEQLAAYFDGTLQAFQLPLAPNGTDFQKRVYNAMLDIPFGETLQYGDIAKKLGTAAQPVGTACGSNPIPIIIPCHRVFSAVGLGRFSGLGGVDTKTKLLQHEKSLPTLF